MSKNDKQMLDAMFRLHGAVWFSILEAIGPVLGARAAGNMRDLGVLNSDNPYCENLCNRLADAELEAHRRGEKFHLCDSLANGGSA